MALQARRAPGRPKGRVATVARKTKETDIRLELHLDGDGRSTVTTGIPFLDHMLELFAKHGLFDVTVQARRAPGRPKGRVATVARKTKETDIRLELHLDGDGRSAVTTGIPFLDHMLD